MLLKMLAKYGQLGKLGYKVRLEVAHQPVWAEGSILRENQRATYCLQNQNMNWMPLALRSPDDPVYVMAIPFDQPSHSIEHH